MITASLPFAVQLEMLREFLQGHPISRDDIIHFFRKHLAKLSIAFTPPKGCEATNKVFALFPGERCCLGNEFINVHAQILSAEPKTDKPPLTAVSGVLFAYLMTLKRKHSCAR